jgi:type II secretory pathway pseudopilin PulG
MLKQTNARPHLKEAFTLMEVMLASAILGSALISLMISVNQSIKINRRSAAVIECSLVLNSAVEQLITDKEIDENSSGTLQVKYHESMHCSYRVSKVELPFESDVLKAETNILKVSVYLEDKRFPNLKFETTRYLFKPTPSAGVLR